MRRSSPRPPEHRRWPGWGILVLTAVVCGGADLALAGVSVTDLPEIGDSSGAFLSPIEEDKLGKEFLRSVRQQARLIEDPDVNAYLDSLGQRLAAASGDPSRTFTFFLVDDAAINAFAGPGGVIGVNTGLIDAAENESELAAVLAHEIAHVTQRHLIRAYEAQNRLSLPTTAAIIAAVLLGVATNADAGIAAVSAIQAGSLQYQINFTRDNEKEADRIGMQSMRSAGIDPFGMSSFFERLQRSTRLYGEGLPEFLSTHPVTTDRIAEAASRAQEIGHGGTRDSREFQLARARLAVLESRDPQTTLRYFQNRVKEQPDSAHDRYGLALALERSGDTDAARKIFEALRKSDPDRILYRTGLADLDLEHGQPDQALKLLDGTLALYPGDVTVSIHYAGALMRTGHAEQARKMLQHLLEKPRAQTPEIYALLARAAEAAGQRWQARQATAEMYFLNGQTKAAVQQLEQALEARDLDYYTRSALEARLKEFKDIAQSEKP